MNGELPNKDYELYLEKVIKKNDKALIDFEAYLEREIQMHGDEHGAHVIEYFIYISAHPTLSLLQKSALIQIFEHISYVIKDQSQLSGYISQLVGSILKYFNDPSEKIRYAAISSIYNIFKFLDDGCLFVFTRTFKQLPCIVTDPSPEVKQAALHLNHTMKTLLNNAILDNRDFDFQDFLNILTQNFLLPHPTVKQFLIDWINSLDQIKSFDSTRYLPLFLKKLFIFLVDENKNVRNKANDCLKGFIDSFRLSFVCSKDTITHKYQEEDTQAILILLVKIIEESIVFEVSSEIDAHVLNWLESFSDFLVEEIHLGLKPFLVKIFTNIFKPLFKVMIQAMSIQSDIVRKISAKIHCNLLKAYPTLRENNKQIQMAAVTLKPSIVSSKTLIKIQIVIQWIKEMGKFDNQLIHNEIDFYIIHIVQKICESTYKNFSHLIPLLSNSIFTKNYFPKLIQALIMHLQLKRVPSQSQILHKIICLSDSNPVETYVLICRQLNQLSNFQKSAFKARISQILFSFLITDKCLGSLLRSILDKTISEQIVAQISRVFVENNGVFIGLSFLLKDYELVVRIIENMSQEHLDHREIVSITKISNYLLHPSLHSVFIDIENKQNMAKLAYLSLIMLLPLNKYTSTLKQKLFQFDDLSQDDDDDGQMEDKLIDSVNRDLVSLHRRRQTEKEQNSPNYIKIISQIYEAYANTNSQILEEG